MPIPTSGSREKTGRETPRQANARKQISHLKQATQTVIDPKASICSTLFDSKRKLGH